MSTHTRAKHRLSRHHVVAGPSRRRPAREDRRRSASDRKTIVLEFVERTTCASGVPLLVEDLGVIDQIGRVLA
jgi:hypothetical protein